MYCQPATRISNPIPIKSVIQPGLINASEAIKPPHAEPFVKLPTHRRGLGFAPVNKLLPNNQDL